ncbi:unnamed protein product [Ranitomeya imitator]|uniref:Uncharacterized protein n=1 Tax=Ranitomeya imitator TaxID=111125 RepID=A0ABN9L1A4_9NEOB|nr:unnamed protein product [Ranitomeya imitator]
MYEIHVESEEFKEKRTVQQHKMVNERALGNLDAPGIPCGIPKEIEQLGLEREQINRELQEMGNRGRLQLGVWKGKEVLLDPQHAWDPATTLPRAPVTMLKDCEMLNRTLIHTLRDAAIATTWDWRRAETNRYYGLATIRSGAPEDVFLNFPIKNMQWTAHRQRTDLGMRAMYENHWGLKNSKKASRDKRLFKKRFKAMHGLRIFTSVPKP